MEANTLFAAAATVFFGVIPQPLVAWAEHAGAALTQSLPSSPPLKSGCA